MGAADSIDLSGKDRKIILELLKKHVPGIKVWAYGSRVKWTAKPASDLDIAVFIADGQKERLSALREAFEESSLPFRVDLFAWDNIPVEFHKNILEKYYVLQDNEKSSPKSSWQKVKLGGYCDKIGSGATPTGGSNVYLSEGNIAFIRSQHVYNDSFHGEGIVYLKDNDADALRNVTVNENDILINITGDSVARVCLAPKEFIPARVNQHVAIIRVKHGIFDARFVRYYLITPAMQQYLLSIACSGGTRNALTKTMLENLEIPKPPLPEQKRIADILSAFDDKIELNRKMCKTLEAMAQALFKSWFIDFDPVLDNALAAGNEIPDELKEKAVLRESLGDARKPLPEDVRKLFPAEFELTEEIGWIPKGWRVQSVDSTIQINPSVTLKKPTTAPFVDMKALPTSGFSIMEISEKPYSGGAKFQNGDVLMARITPCLENGKTGIVDFLEDAQVGFGSTEFNVLRGKNAIHTPYVACLSRNERFRTHCIQGMVGSSGRQRVSNACFSAFFLALPEKEKILEMFNHIVDASFKKISIHSKQQRILATFRDILLVKLLSGETSISEAEKLEEEIE